MGNEAITDGVGNGIAGFLNLVGPRVAVDL